MPNNHFFYQYLSECQHPELYCFDLEQYNPDAPTLDVSVWTNFRGQIYYSEDFKVDTRSCCRWYKNKWIIKNYNTLLLQGLNNIAQYLLETYIERD